MTRFSDHPNPTLAVDILALSVTGGRLHGLFLYREDMAAWALPGAIVHHGKPLEEAVGRALAKTDLGALHLEQLATYGDPARDPRGHVVSVAYLAISAEPLPGSVEIRDGVAELPGPLAFDHKAIVADAVTRLRGKIDYSPIGFAFLAPAFTLGAVQEVHEAILGRSLTKPAFRRKLTDRHALRPTGRFQTGAAFRPAELFELE